MLAILSFNWYGYRLLTTFLESRNNARFQIAIDQHLYKESSLISVKVAATHISGYNIRSTEFKRVDGRIDINGIQYNYVKRRLCNDSIEMLCIPNQTATELKKLKNDFFSLANDLKNPAQKKSDSRSSKTYSDDYYTMSDPSPSIAACGHLLKQSFQFAEKLSESHGAVDEHPPQLIS